MVLHAKGQGPNVIASDFNAWVTERGDSLTNTRGWILDNNEHINSYLKGEFGWVVDWNSVSPSLARQVLERK